MSIQDFSHKSHLICNKTSVEAIPRKIEKNVLKYLFDVRYRALRGGRATALAIHRAVRHAITKAIHQRHEELIFFEKNARRYTSCKGPGSLFVSRKNHGL